MTMNIATSPSAPLTNEVGSDPIEAVFEEIGAASRSPPLSAGRGPDRVVYLSGTNTRPADCRPLLSNPPEAAKNAA